jgi:lipoate synthase
MNKNNSPKETYLNYFSDFTKENLIKEIIFNQKEVKNHNIETTEILLKISKRLNILVWFLVIIPIICTLIFILLS